MVVMMEKEIIKSLKRVDRFDVRVRWQLEVRLVHGRYEREYGDPEVDDSITLRNVDR